jgi:Uma2 family endonuclease
MPRLILPADEMKRIIRRRQRTGADRYDEVWDGVYVMSPIANNEHQRFVGDLTYVFKVALGDFPGEALPGANVSDREDDWTRNYRCPDVVVILPGSAAQDRETHFLGGPDFAVEVISPGDRSRKKLDFYASVGVRELLLVDRKPWRLELYRLEGERLTLAGTAIPGGAEPIPSLVLPVAFRLTAETPRPRIEVTHRSDGRVWFV